MVQINSICNIIFLNIPLVSTLRDREDLTIPDFAMTVKSVT